MEAIVSPTPTDITPAKSGKTLEKSHPTKARGAKHQKNHTIQKHEGQNIRKITPYKNMRGKTSEKSHHTKT